MELSNMPLELNFYHYYDGFANIVQTKTFKLPMPYFIER